MGLTDKYIVFKREDYDAVDHLPYITDALRRKAIGDCFVLRASDVFAPQALFGYAHGIQSYLEIDALPGRAVFTDDERERLTVLADDLMTLGLKWNTTPKKIPD